MPKSYEDNLSKVPMSQSTEKSNNVHRQSTDFRAKIIPYDTSEDPNAPILAYSGDNINLIFNIPKEKFRKLAVAVIDHLGHVSDSESEEGSDSAGNNRSRNSKSNEASAKSRLSDVVRNLETNNTTEIMDAYEEDSNEVQHSKKKNDVRPADQKSPTDGSNVSIEFKEESESIAEKGNRSTKMAFHFEKPEDPADIKTSSPNSVRGLSTVEKYGELQTSIATGINDENNDSNCETHDRVEANKEMECEDKSGDNNVKTNLDKSEVGSIGDNTTYDIERSEDYATERDVNTGKRNLSAHSLDISYEDCPEMQNEWPSIHPFTETEEIPIKELKSLQLNGIFTKYLKLECSSEFIVLKVASESNVLVDAVKYKGTEKDSSPKIDENTKELKSELSGKAADASFVCNVSTKSSVDECHADSIEETSKISKNLNDEQKDKEISVLVPENTIASETVEKSSNLELEAVAVQNLRTESFSTKILNEDSDRTTNTLGAGNLNSLKLDLVEDIPPANISLNVTESKSPDKTLETTMPDSFLENEEFRHIRIKVEQNMDELDANVPGTSPTERLKFALADNLKSPRSKIESEKPTATRITLKSPNKVVSNAEEELSGSDLKRASISPENLNISISDKIVESVEKVSEDNLENEKSILICDNSKEEHSNNADFQEETKNERESIDLPSADKGDSLDDSALCIDLNVSETETKNSTQLVNIEGTKVCPDETLNSTLEEREINETFEDTVDDSCDSEKANDVQEAQSEQSVIEENDTLIETIENSKLKESENSTEKSLLEEQKLTKSSLEDDSKENDVQEAQPEQSVIEENDTLIKTIENNKLNESENATEKSLLEEQKLSESTLEDGSNRDYVRETLATDETLSSGNQKRCNIEEVKMDEKMEEKENETPEIDLIEETLDKMQSPSEDQNPGKSSIASLESESSGDVNDTNDDVETESNPDVNEAVILNETSDLSEHESSSKRDSNDSENKILVNQTLENMKNIPEDVDDSKITLPEHSFASNMDSFMDSTMDTHIESASESCDFESDEVKSITSESDDSKDSGKHVLKRTGSRKKLYGADEVDCAPTRTRNRKAGFCLSKDTIPEDTELKSSSKARSLHVASKHSGKTSPVGRSLRSKSLEPTTQPSKALDKKHSSIVESEERSRKTRATTPDIIVKKDIKTASRSSPRKLVRSSATTDIGSASKTQNTKSGAGSSHSKSKSNLDASATTAKRSKRGVKD